MTTVKSEVLETIKETYVFLRTTQGPKSFTYKLDRDFISQPGDDIILVDVNNPTNTYEFKVGYDIKVSNFRQNEVFRTIKKTETVEQLETLNFDCTYFDGTSFKNKILDSLNYKFNNTPLVSIWSKVIQNSSLQQKEKLNNALNILEKANYLSNDIKNELYKKIVDRNKFVFGDNGEWLPINKLTGNKHQFVEIISSIIEMSFEEKNAQDVYFKILSGNDSNTVINVEYKKYFEDKLELLGFDWLKNQTNLIELFSKKGKDTENEFVKSINSKSPNAVILYEGGDGDLFDINLSVDLIVDFGIESKHGIKTIQIKNSENAFQMMMSKYNKNSDFYKYIDWVVYPKKGGGWELKDLTNG